MQAQDERGFRLAIRVRTRGLTAADVDRALGDGSLVVTWLNRGTLHLVRAEDYPWLHALTAPRQLAATVRRLGQEGVSEAAADRGVAAIERALADEGPLKRDQLAERVARRGVRTEGQALIHLLALASIRGLIVRGPVVEGRHAYVLVRDWLPRPGPFDRDAALAELARRYLAGHAPADDRDLAKWSGLALRDARAGLAAVGEPATPRSGEEPLPARLLGAFDPLLLGWASREWLTGPHDARVVSGGIFRPFGLVDGRPAATWRLSRGAVELDPLADTDTRALDAEAADVERFLAPR